MSGDPITQVTEELTYPAFNPAFVPVQLDPNTVHIRIGPWTGPVYTLSDADGDAQLARLVEQLDGEQHVETILESFDEDDRVSIASLLVDLHEKDVVLDQSQADPRYAHMPLRRRFANRERRRLEELDVLVVNSGTMGAQIATDLREFGVGEVAALQPVASASDSRIEACADEMFDPEALEAAVSGADFVVYAGDRPRPQLTDTINRVAHETKTAWSSVQIHGFDGIVGPTVFPGETACYRCFEKRQLSNVVNNVGYERYAEYVDDAADAVQARVPGFSRLLAGYLVLDLANVLPFGTGYTAGRVFVVDGIHLSVECNDVLKYPRCEVCGKPRGESVSQFITVDDIRDAGNWVGTEGRK
ncbi:TOMM precursor leader peptide-binding protein [Natronobiforma cellulositropha]|uniref:TOMM precursor leader peptide-binding protein n=1 Tax=Natronobiforma cellulositropha TaxID=1679076 RepID=UPI0021D5AAE5|nr:TOMM precursor leader peptide-binding protein [Natronobiforma cellulositropha]